MLTSEATLPVAIPMSHLARRQSGLGLVELMVGITVGLIVAAGATVMAVNQINEHRRLMVETQMQQDIRATADLLIQETRRAGYRYWAEQGAWSPGSDTQAVEFAAPNPHANIEQPEMEGVEPAIQGTFETLTYQYYYQRSLPNRNLASITNTVASNNEYGFKRVGDVISIQIGSTNWQPVTDPTSIQIRSFPITVSRQALSLEDFCDKPCNGAANCPSQEIRRVDFTLVAKSKALPEIERTVSVSERVRADEVTGACPS